jgi:hypothetical protein
MALPVNRPHNEVAVSTHMADVSAASSAYAVATHRGRIKRAYTVLATTLTGAAANVTVHVRGGSSIGTIEIAAESTAGTVDSKELGYQGTSNFVNEGDLITFTSDGGSSTTSVTRCTAIIERAN